ncbi:MAG: 2-oxoacid:acceptor oxidoreductase subunit alpha [Opitutales bacterium]|nr:2-oxoacid:acceptor oxidoreductase subunit alpha [Opitutales bacterium]
MVQKREETVIRIVGHAQDGVQSLGSLLAKLAGRSGYQVMTYMTIPATIAGGSSVYQLRIGVNPILTSGDVSDLLIALHQDSLDAHKNALKKGGMLLTDSDQVKECEGVDFEKHFAIPMSIKMNELLEGRGARGKNMFLLGMLCNLLGIDEAKVEQLAVEKFGSKGEAVIGNVRKAIQAGFKYEWDNGYPEIALQAVENPPNQVTMDGNSAVAYGLIASGIRYGAAYPITPATSIMEMLREELPKYKGIFVQTEDEIAAVCAAIGMSYSGHLAVTSTSGPGMSLKMEALGWAVMAEMPLIVVNVQRGGPSTGIPTQVEQSDLMQTLYGSHGDAPKVVLAARNVEECFHICREAVKLAREFSTPVYILSDQGLSTRIEGFQMPDLDEVMIEPVLDLSDRPEDFLPYPPEGITQHAPPGTKILSGKYPTVTGLEHDEKGNPNPSPDNHMKMSAKRREKIKLIEKQSVEPEFYGDKEGDVLLVSWGSSFGSARETTMRLQEQGKKVSHMHVKMIFPLKKSIGSVFEKFKDVYTVELNDEGVYGVGQFGMLLRSTTCCSNIQSICKTDGLTFKVSEIMDRLS